MALQVLKTADRADGKEDGRISIAELKCAMDSWEQVHRSYEEGRKAAAGCASVWHWLGLSKSWQGSRPGL